MVSIEQSTEYAKILFAIQLGNRTLTQIAETVGKSKPCLMEQLARLKEAGYIKPEEKKEAGFSVKWQINKNALINYWSKRFKGFNVKDAKENFETWFSLLATTPFFTAFPQNIESMGHFFSMSLSLNEEKENILDKPLKDLLFAKKSEIQEAKKIIRKMRKENRLKIR